jgi:hypothetical protein
MLISDEKKRAARLEQQKNEGVTGRYKRRYHFTLKQQHWITPGYLTRHQMTGQLDCGLIHAGADGLQTWSFEMRNLQFDWNPNAVPEIYFLFAYPSRIDLNINKDGKLTDGGTSVNYQERWNRQYKKEIALRLKGDERAENLLHALGGIKNNDKLALGLLEVNPLVVALGNMVKLNYNLNHCNEPAGEFGERFTGEIVKENYFSGNIPLPLKTTWIKRETEEENIEEWTHLGGLVKEKYPEYELRKQLRMITGNQNPPTDNPQVEFAELYRMERVSSDFLQLAYGLLQTETLLADTWVKSEELELITDENGIVYGTE